MPGPLQVPGEHGVEKVGIKNRGRRMIMGLTATVAAGPETVTEVMEEQSRFDGVEVNQADGPIRIRGKEKIGDFRVAMDHLKTQLVPCPFEHLHGMALLGNQSKAKGLPLVASRATGTDLLVAGQIVGGTMEAGQRISQVNRLNGSRQQMKPAEQTADLRSLLRVCKVLRVRVFSI
jgi:hypothetical protein